MLFSYYKKAIRFAALSLDEHGIEDYGKYFMLLREDMIAHRATVFEANSVKFVKAKVIAMGSIQIPAGYRAVWQERGHLAVAKLAWHLAANTPAEAFPRLLLTGRDDRLDNFIEVHNYGPMTIRSFAKVTVPRGGRGIGRKVRLRALREHMARFNVPCEERAL
jgi:hypothetical protein